MADRKTTDAVRHLRPLGDRALVRPHEPEKVSKGGVIIPDSIALRAGGYWRWGTVVAVGNGKRLADGTRAPMDIRPGDEVYFSHFTAFETGPETDVEELCIVFEQDIALVRDATPA